jgi:hypothetical protein
MYKTPETTFFMCESCQVKLSCAQGRVCVRTLLSSQKPSCCLLDFIFILTFYFLDILCCDFCSIAVASCRMRPSFFGIVPWHCSLYNTKLVPSHLFHLCLFVFCRRRIVTKILFFFYSCCLCVRYLAAFYFCVIRRCRLPLVCFVDDV